MNKEMNLRQAQILATKSELESVFEEGKPPRDIFLIFDNIKYVRKLEEHPEVENGFGFQWGEWEIDNS